MFNAKRIDDIRNNLQVSTLLTDHEKSDWLNLLELMNDKQLSELEEILAATPPPSSQAANTKIGVQPIPSMPPLSHIANVPTDVTMTHSVPNPLDANPLVAPKPNPPVAPAIPRPMTPATPVPAHKPMPPIHSSFNPAPVKPPGEASMAAKTSVPATSAKRTSNKFPLNDPEELRNMSVAALREFDLQSIADAIRNTIQQRGYFPILQILEASPLYKSYIETGKSMLGDTKKKIDAQSSLTQPEFEFITDLLRHMRFNTW